MAGPDFPKWFSLCALCLCGSIPTAEFRIIGIATESAKDAKNLSQKNRIFEPFCGQGSVLNARLGPAYFHFTAATAATKAFALAVIAAQFFSLSALASTSELPAAVANAPALMQSP